MLPVFKISNPIPEKTRLRVIFNLFDSISKYSILFNGKYEEKIDGPAKELMWLANKLIISEMIDQLNILNIALLLSAYNKLKHVNSEDWKALIKRFLMISSEDLIKDEKNEEGLT